MKKIFFIILCFLTACASDYKTAPTLKEYTQIPLMELPVQRVNIISTISTQNKIDTDISPLMKIAPETFLHNWALMRLRPNYKTKNKADVILEKAQITRKEAPEAKFFIFDNFKYTFSYQISIQVKDPEELSIKKTTIEGFVSKKLPQKATEKHVQNMLQEILVQVEDQLDQEMEKEIRNKFLDL